MKSDLTMLDAAGEGERRSSLVDDAYLAMKDAIREARFPPGYQASEQEIAMRLGMSRTPVHEAAVRLQEDGLVRVLPRRGILICPLAPADIQEIYDVIIALEGRAVELLAELPEQPRAAVVALLAAYTADMASAEKSGDLAAWAHADDLFHRALIEGAGNGRMIRIIQTVSDQAHRARTLTVKLRRDREVSVEEHRKIIEAIEAGGGAAAQEWARQHRGRARDELVPLLEMLGLNHL